MADSNYEKAQREALVQQDVLIAQTFAMLAICDAVRELTEAVKARPMGHLT